MFSFGVKTIVVVLCFLLLMSFVSCAALEEKMITSSHEDEIITSLGQYTDYEFYTEGDFQDYTDYAKYYYESANFSENNHFTKIQNADFERINEHLDDFENWIASFKNNDESAEIVVNYDFDRNLIDKDDYIYISSEKHTYDNGQTSLVNYNIYFFDSQSKTLYYFHNNM